ncbi:MAG: hypothetical protein JRJ68_11245 [Deltaproteobacteria bacterium]|nr:hypothetical protein [Deltaproteobacteria bacterium]
MRADEGIAHIALGVGKTVVDGEKSLWFSPSHPKKLVQFSSVDNMLQYSQRQFYALDMSTGGCLQRRGSNLAVRTVQKAEKELPVIMLASTYVADEHRIRDAHMPGMKIMTFAQLLKYPKYPLSGILQQLLKVGRESMGCDVEIEFAVHLEREIEKSVFYFLQIRPMVTGGEQVDVQICDDEIESAFCYTSQSLGHGNFNTIADIVFVDPNSFDPVKTEVMSYEIGEMNRQLQNQDRPYLLIGPGRWGSSDPWLGIPVKWNNISGVAAIIEVRNHTIRADPSQGSHFFQNITSLGIPYLTLTENGDAAPGKRHDFLDWDWLKEQDLIEKTKYINHIRLKEPFILKCDGTKSESVLFSAMSPCRRKCAVQGKELWNQVAIQGERCDEDV